MLTRVEITNYRGFPTYRMEGLSRVNLLVGKNNSGKTALLEGIQFLTSGGDVAVLAEVADRRGEVIFGRPEPAVSVDIAHFFYGHALASEMSFSISGDNGYTPVTVKTYTEKNEGAETRPQRVARPPGLYVKITTGASKAERDEPRFRISREGGVDLEVGPRYRHREVRVNLVDPKYASLAPIRLIQLSLQ